MATLDEVVHIAETKGKRRLDTTTMQATTASDECDDCDDDDDDKRHEQSMWATTTTTTRAAALEVHPILDECRHPVEIAHLAENECMRRVQATSAI